MRDNELKDLQIKHSDLEKQFADLVDALIESETIRKNYFMGRIYLHSNVNVLKYNARTEDKLETILNHLGLEFEWVDCKPHYELKKKEDE